MSFCVRFDSFVGYLDIFSGLFRFSRIYSNYIGDSAETVALAITSIRCNGVVTTSPRHAKCIAHFLSSSRVLAVRELLGAKLELVDYSTRDVSFRLALNVLDTGCADIGDTNLI